jgi:hypothetical protein
MLNILTFCSFSPLGHAIGFSHHGDTDLGTIQAGQVQVFCSLPGAEPQVSNVVATNTMNPSSNMASPIHASATASASATAGTPTNNSQNAMDASGKNKPATEQSVQKSGASHWAVGDSSMIAALGVVSLYMAL